MKNGLTLRSNQHQLDYTKANIRNLIDQPNTGLHVKPMARNAIGNDNQQIRSNIICEFYYLLSKHNHLYTAAKLFFEKKSTVNST